MFQYNEIHWWLIIGMNLVGYLVFRFGMIWGRESGDVIEFFGGTTLLFSFVTMFWIYGWKAGFVLVPLFWFVTTPVVEIVMELVKSSEAVKKRRRVEEIRMSLIAALEEAAVEEEEEERPRSSTG